MGMRSILSTLIKMYLSPVFVHTGRTDLSREMMLEDNGEFDHIICDLIHLNHDD